MNSTKHFLLKFCILTCFNDLKIVILLVLNQLINKIITEPAPSKWGYPGLEPPKGCQLRTLQYTRITLYLMSSSLGSLSPCWRPYPRWLRGGRCWRSPWWWQRSPASWGATRRHHPRTWWPWWTPAQRRPPSHPQF